MCSQTRNSCAKAFDNCSRSKNLKPKIRGGSIWPPPPSRLLGIIKVFSRGSETTWILRSVLEDFEKENPAAPGKQEKKILLDKLNIKHHVSTRKKNMSCLGPVHTMPDKFENATLLLWIRLPSTLIRLYPHKEIHENGTFENVFQSGTIRKRNFFVLVWTENFLYPQLFEYADVILSTSTLRRIWYFLCSWQYLSSLIAYFELNIALLRQRASNNFIQAFIMERDNDNIRATLRYRSCKKLHFWIRLAEPWRMAGKL